jgi:transposase
VSRNFLYPQCDQPLLMPVDMREWLPEDDLVFVVLDAVATLDLGEFRRRYRADGTGAAFDPEVMVALLLYGYCRGERSSRVIEQRCVRDVVYRVIPGGLHPDHAIIARFRARHDSDQSRYLAHIRSRYAQPKVADRVLHAAQNADILCREGRRVVAACNKRQCLG